MEWVIYGNSNTGFGASIKKMQAIGNEKTVKRIARKAMRQAMNIVRDKAREKLNA